MTHPQLNRLSEFSANLALVFLASVITPLFTGTDIINLERVILGLVLMLIALTASLLMAKEKTK